MRFRDKPRLQDALAREYVLGTLRGLARRRFERWVEKDGATARAVREWEARLNALALALPPIDPPARVWAEIRRRIEPAGCARPRWAGYWHNIAFWRMWGLVATGVAAGLFAMATLRAPDAPPQAQPPSAIPASASATEPSYIALLTDEKRQVRIVARAPRHSKELWIKVEGMTPPEPGRVYVLWALSDDPAEAPRWIGLLPATQVGTIKLASSAQQTFADFQQMAVSAEVEPHPALPTGPILAKGECIPTW